MGNKGTDSSRGSDQPRLIERGFPLKQASLDSVHEKNVRHGHISTLHIWPARRPLAACRAALIATLLPDPGDPEERRRLIERIGGRVVPKIEKKKVNGKSVEIEREETIGGILHWGRESDPDMQFFRDEIRKAYGGRAPRVLDPFAGGGAIPLEAMRLGCEVTAIDINPVAWFILKCTLEYPQKLAGQKRPLRNSCCTTATSWNRSSKRRASKARRFGPNWSGSDWARRTALHSLLPHRREGKRGERRAVRTRRRFALVRGGPRVACAGVGMVGAPAGEGRPRTFLSDDRWQADRRLSVGADGEM